MTRANVVRGIGGVTVVVLAAVWVSGGHLMGQAGQQNRTEPPSSVRPACGTRPLTDAETAADATRVAEFKKRRADSGGFRRSS